MRSRRWGAARAIALLVVSLCCSGCNLLLNEFTWLDRAGPSARKAPDAPVEATRDRP